jgi:hypothetical protein
MITVRVFPGFFFGPGWQELKIQIQVQIFRGRRVFIGVGHHQDAVACGQRPGRAGTLVMENEVWLRVWRF